MKALEYLRELKAKMVRDPLPPEDVAGGWALGMFVGCAVPFGLQLLVSVPLSIMMRVSKIGATVGTLITNPVSIFLIYPAQTMMMAWILRRDISWSTIKSAMLALARDGGWSKLMAMSGELIICFLLGGFLLALIFTPITYFAVKRIVIRHRARLGGK